jgi:hypothetical protein
MKLELTKKELYAYAFEKYNQVNSSDEEKYLHKNIYKAFVCPPIEDGIATTYEDVDKLIKDNTTCDPKTTEDYAYEQIDKEYKQRKIVVTDWCNRLNDDELATFKKLFDMVSSGYDDYCDFQTIKTVLNNK